jgi:flagellar hook-length control protein FliK
LLNQTRQGIEAGLQNGKTSLRLRLVPDDLGGIDLRVTTGPQGASVLIRAENPATGRLLEQNLSDLRHALQDAGVQLNNLSVGQQGAQNGQFSGQQAPSQHGLPNAFQRHAPAHPAVANTEDADGALRRNGVTSQVNYLV